MRSIEELRTEIRISDAAVDDLRRRLRQTRWPIVPLAEDWTYGTQPGPLQRLIDYWEADFDWQRWRQDLNRHSHYLLPVPAATDHRLVHAVVLRSAAGLRPPVVMVHGWPGSFVEFLGVAERLAAPERFGGAPHDGATVILLSLPGTAMSSAPAVPVGPRGIAADFHAVITRTLGIDRFLMHGGDWGAAVASWLAVDAPQCLHGLHLTSAIMQPDVAGLELGDAEREFLARRARRGPWESGYQIIQGTKPATLSYALTDSPTGLAAWLLEKYQSWGCARGTADLPPIPFDELLSIIGLYWFYGPGPASWIYRSLVDGTGLRFPRGTRVTVPTAICSFAFDVSPPSPPAWQQRAYEVVRRTAVDHGSHFPGLDATVALAEDIACFSADLPDRWLNG